MWLNISKWVGGRQKPFWIRLTDVQQRSKFVKFLIMASDDRWNIFFKIHILVVWHGQKSLLTLFVSLIDLLEKTKTKKKKTFNCLKHGFLNSWNSNIPILFFSYLWNGRWYQMIFMSKWFLIPEYIDSKITIWSPWRHQTHLLWLSHIFRLFGSLWFSPDIGKVFRLA